MRCLVAILLLTTPALAKKFQIPETTRQIVLVLADSWSGTTGKLTRHQRAGGAWQQVGESIDVVLGAGGLGWGLGLHSPHDGGPLKQEGDSRSPAGVYRLSETLGYDGQANTRMPYRAIDPGLRCVDDPRSRQYNRLVRQGPGEEMRRDDQQYSRVVVVDHNRPQSRPGRGSCIFIHVWAAPGTPTTGCTALARDALDDLLAWLDPAARPLLVQLTRDDYATLKDSWRLP